MVIPAMTTENASTCCSFSSSPSPATPIAATSTCEWSTGSAARRLPPSLDDFDWRKFQQEYRDYIDLAKLAQLLPVIGAPVGVVANNRLVRKLGRTAMNAYRMRWFEERR